MLLYRLRIQVERADLAYFNCAFTGVVRTVLRASVNVGYNPRRQANRFPVDSFFIRRRCDSMSPRAKIERHFAWLNHCFGLKVFRVQGYFAATKFVFRVDVAALIVASSPPATGDQS